VNSGAIYRRTLGISRKDKIKNAEVPVKVAEKELQFYRRMARQNGSYCQDIVIQNGKRWKNLAHLSSKRKKKKCVESLTCKFAMIYPVTDFAPEVSGGWLTSYAYKKNSFRLQ